MFNIFDKDEKIAEARRPWSRAASSGRSWQNDAPARLPRGSSQSHDPRLDQPCEHLGHEPTARTDDGPRQFPPPPIEGRARKIEDLPKEVGVMLVSVGVLGFPPAVAGTPAIVAGGLVLSACGGRSGNSSGGSNAATPWCIMRGCAQICRYLDDLEMRFPDSSRR